MFLLTLCQIKSIISSCQLAATSDIVKRCWSRFGSYKQFYLLLLPWQEFLVAGPQTENSLLASLPAGLREAQPCRYCFYSVVQKCFFSPRRGRHVTPINVKFGTGEWTAAPPCQISRISRQKCGNTAPKTVRISNFGHKFAPHERSFALFFTKFSAFVRVYR